MAVFADLDPGIPGQSGMCSSRVQGQFVGVGIATESKIEAPDGPRDRASRSSSRAVSAHAQWPAVAQVSSRVRSASVAVSNQLPDHRQRRLGVVAPDDWLPAPGGGAIARSVETGEQLATLPAGARCNLFVHSSVRSMPHFRRS